MKHPPLISIIIPVYKVEEYLDYCVKSIINQEFKDFEIILIDDGSPDNCPAICDEWAHKDNRIRVIHKENGGLSDARNYGIDTAKGEYVWFVDSDDWIAEDSLKSIVYGCEKYPQADAIAVQIIEIRDGNKVFNGSIKEWPMEDTLISNSNFVERFTSILPSVRYIVKNDVYKKNNLRFITGILHEDIPFCHMLMHYIKYIALIPKVAYLYRIRGGSITTTPNINSCYSLVKSHKLLMSFMDSVVPVNERNWFLCLSYDIFYEMFLRIKPFIGKMPYKEFMMEHGKYVKNEFWKLRNILHGKRKLLLYLFMISPQLFSNIIYKKRYSK